jgi:RHS repeat-associated protein
MLKVTSWILVIAVLAAFLPANVSAHPLDLSGVGRFGQKVAKIAGDAGKILSELKTNLAADVQKITTSTTTTTNLPPTSEVVQKITSDVDPDKDNQLSSPSGKITLTIPKGAVSKASQVEFTEYIPQASSGMVMLNRFSLTAKEKVSGVAFSKFNQNLQISIQHNTGDLDGVDPASVRLYYQDEKTKQWLPLSDSAYDSKANVVSATTNHFTHFGEQASPISALAGRIMASQVNLHTGAATFSYPFELPPGPGGFQPKLELDYNSGIVDEMKNKQTVGSWAGIGWNLKLGSISYDATSNNYFLDLNGGSYQLTTADNLNYRTNPEQYYQITRDSVGGNLWTLRDKDGNVYQFGGDPSSDTTVQFTNGLVERDGTRSYDGIYRWDLKMMKDTNNNQANITYQRGSGGYTDNAGRSHGWVRSSYPLTMQYGNITVSFNTTSDQNAGALEGPVRYDTPISYSGVYPWSVITDTAKLNYIEIKVDSNVIRKYVFTYDQTNRVYSTDYGGIYYAGILKLSSITQKDKDDNALPAMQFTYTDLNLYRHGSVDEYTGNPGNPASLTWPYLTGINSGYGGTTTFAYSQKPTTSTMDKWTRQVVISKTINGGITGNETTTYDYTGDPQYYLDNWSQEYRGFGEVKETDSDGNYVKHLYYTTGNVNNQEADRFTGNEYKTQWYTSVNTLLKEKTYDWGWQSTSQSFDNHHFFGDPNHYYWGVAVASDGSVYASENDSYKIKKYDKYGKFILDWNCSMPAGLGLDTSGNVYVTEQGNCVQKFSPTGTSLLSFGNYGTGNGQFNYPSDVAVDSSGNIYVSDTNNYRVQKFNSSGAYLTQWPVYVSGDSTYYAAPTGIALDSSGNVLVIDWGNKKIKVFNASGGYVSSFGAPGTGDGQFSNPYGIFVTCDNCIYVTDFDNSYQPTVSRIEKFNPNYSFNSTLDCNSEFPVPKGVAGSSDALYIVGNFPLIMGYLKNWTVRLNKVEETIGTKNTRTEYAYDGYGNIITEKVWGDTASTTDNSIITYIYNANTTANIIDKPAQEKVYLASDDTFTINEANLKRETHYYYDGNNTSLTTPPTKGMVTSVESKKDVSSSVSTYATYDTYGNILTSTDANANVTTTTWDTTYHTYPLTKTYPITSLAESYTYDPGTCNLLTSTNVNGQITNYYYDTFKRLTSVVKPGDSQGSPGITYQYNNWGTLNSQNVKTINKIDATNSIWKADYFDGLGRVVQTQTQSETGGHTIISGTTTYNTCGQVDKQYLAQDIPSNLSAYYNTGISSWKCTSYAYDGLGRVVTQTNPDGTTASNDYTTPWQTNSTNTRGLITRNFFDAFGRLIQVQEPNSDNTVYATTHYTYDILGNLTQVQDAANNTTSMTYNGLSRKTGMTDPDMGAWSYVYDNNGNLTTQTDAKGQTITMIYDTMNRLTNKNYPSGSGMTNIVYTYDSTANGNLGKGLRTGMTDAAGTTADKYDTRGRLIEEKKTIDAVDYTTSYTYDGLDRAAAITYPNPSGTGETVTNTFNGRGLPNAVTGSAAGNLVTGTLYNTLGSITQINLGNNLKTNYSYWGIDHSTTSYGKLWEIKTQPQAGGTAIQDMQYTWDNNSNLTQRQNMVSNETESFTYDSLDRLTGATGTSAQAPSNNGTISISMSGAPTSPGSATISVLMSGASAQGYTQSYTYNAIGNITAMNGTSYSYPTNGVRPHAVTQVGSTSYSYDANGNMTTRGGQTITWDVENRPLTVTGGATFVYNGDGNRVKKTEGGQTILYINQYYEKNITTGVVTTSYYLGGQLVATREGTTLRYVHQDSLGSTSSMSTSTGTLDSSISFFPFGNCRFSQGNLGTDKLFTGQRLDSTGLYYYNARYYDATIGRFISPDSTGQKLNDPQTLNRYSYCINNPLNRTDLTGHFSWKTAFKVATVVLAIAAVVAVSIAVPALVVAAAPAIAAFAPVITGAVGGAVSYTATKIAVNTVNERPALEGFSPLVCATNAAAGACFSQVTSIIGNALLNQPNNIGSGLQSSDTVSIYRGVDDSELTDLKSSQTFNPDPKGSPAKYFCFTSTDASREAELQYIAFKKISTIVQTQIPLNLLTPDMFGECDPDIPFIALPNELLPSLSPPVIQDYMDYP